MKLTFLLSTLFLLTFAFVASAAPVSGQTSSKPAERARLFYAWYLGELNRDANPIQNNRELSKFLTARYLKAVKRAVASEEGIGADVFVDGQDWDTAWANNISTSRAVISGRRARLTVTLKGKNPGMGTKRLRLVMQNEGNAWKIDSVNGLANP